MKKVILTILGIALITILTSCASTPFAGSEQKDLAIVSIMYNKQLYSYETKTKIESNGTFTTSTSRIGNDPFLSIWENKIDPTDIQKLKEKQFTAPIIPESNQIIRDKFENHSNIKLISQSELNNIQKYKDLNNKTTAKLYNFSNKITSPEYALADYTSKIEPTLYNETGADLFAYINVDIMKKIKGPLAKLETGTLYPEIQIQCILTNSAGKKVYNTFVDVVYFEGVKIKVTNYNKDEFYELLPSAIENAMDALMAKL